MHTASCPSPAPARPWLRLCVAALRRLAAAAHDPDEADLACATDGADLERRLRRLERGRPDRFGPLPP